MKKNILLVLMLSFFACKNANTASTFHHILESKDINEIENYLKNIHPDDPKKNILKSKLIALKNAEWTKGQKNAKPMEARPMISEIPNGALKKPNSDEAEEFKRLIASSSIEHKEKTVKLLNAMFNEDINSKEIILLFRNQSDCNLVLKIQGKDFYNMAVPAKGENFIVINKGTYTLQGNVCDVVYSSKKDINKSLFLTISNPRPPQGNTLRKK